MTEHFKARTGRMARRGGFAAAALMAMTMLTPASSVAQDEQETITGVMHSGLRVLDPIITTAHITRNHGYMIYDVLLAQDEDFQPHPQMADWEVSDDNLVYTFTLRDGLKFHDGEPVTAEDVVASLERWGEVDSGGQQIFDVTDSLEATDEKTVTWTLSEPFPPMLQVLSKQSARPAFIMPKRVAETPSDTSIDEYVGSGPFVFNEDEFDPGQKVVYDKFEDYVPRDEEANWMAGGKEVNVDRVEWVSMSDMMTSVNALAEGEIDYIEQVEVDLLPILDANENVTVERRDPLGYQTIGRMNFKHPPFDNQKIRQAALLALSQEDVLGTMIGNPDYYELCGSVFGCGTPLEDETGAESLLEGGDPEAAQALLDEAGYDGTPIVLMQPTDVASLDDQPVVAAQAFREAGFEVDMQPMDWQSVVSRRASMDPPDEGGWNIFFTNWQLPEVADPLINPMLNSRGDSAWFGWPDDEHMEDLRSQYVDAKTEDERKEIASEIQAYALETVNYIPLGQYFMPQARRNNVVDMIPSPVPVFWNIDKE
ncbi:ABC transporter substrate-binding protein [Fodinicurvata fenggangensis]|uniref:ABC transporter substrate-binding protein n=1 Tax=Fodinicurvata fenggangensis TaxID=1121830 RepID=UPI000A64AAEB|nr:ABC transporter substrate-binding protein [Fodinicurvata fenggangensis]